jgi:hypothetical protein
MCGIKTTFMITQECVAFSMGKKFLSLENFYTNIVTGVSDYYQVCADLTCSPNLQPVRTSDTGRNAGADSDADVDAVAENDYEHKIIMAGMLPKGQQVMMGVNPGGVDVVAEDPPPHTHTHTGKAKGVSAIMPGSLRGQQ